MQRYCFFCIYTRKNAQKGDFLVNRQMSFVFFRSVLRTGAQEEPSSRAVLLITWFQALCKTLIGGNSDAFRRELGGNSDSNALKLFFDCTPEFLRTSYICPSYFPMAFASFQISLPVFSSASKGKSPKSSASIWSVTQRKSSGLSPNLQVSPSIMSSLPL